MYLARCDMQELVEGAVEFRIITSGVAFTTERLAKRECKRMMQKILGNKTGNLWFRDKRSEYRLVRYYNGQIVATAEFRAIRVIGELTGQIFDDVA